MRVHDLWVSSVAPPERPVPGRRDHRLDPLGVSARTRCGELITFEQSASDTEDGLATSAWSDAVWTP